MRRKNSRKEQVLTNLRNGHSTLYIVGEHQSGLFQYCHEPEMGELMLLICRQYSKEGKLIMDGLRKMGMLDRDENFDLGGEFRRKKEVLYF